MRNVAQRLLAVEVALSVAHGAHEAESVCEKLRVALTRFGGADGVFAA